MSEYLLTHGDFLTGIGWGFLAGALLLFLLYIYTRSWVDYTIDKLSRGRTAGWFIPANYHRDSISDRVYGYYMWNRQDGFEWISPYLREMLQIDDYNMTLDKVLQ